MLSLNKINWALKGAHQTNPGNVIKFIYLRSTEQRQGNVQVNYRATISGHCIDSTDAWASSSDEQCYVQIL